MPAEGLLALSGEFVENIGYASTWVGEHRVMLTGGKSLAGQSIAIAYKVLNGDKKNESLV